nr:Triose-phosphate Transporter [Polyrhizophydium stewartii]
MLRLHRRLAPIADNRLGLLLGGLLGGLLRCAGTLRPCSIASWFTISIFMHILNKWLFSRDHFAFPFPMFTTMTQMLVQFALAFCVLRMCFPDLMPKRLPSAFDYMSKVLPCGVATGLDIGLSNSSLKSISLSFYTMVKSGAPVFVLLFAFLFGLEKPTASMLAVIIVIVMGVWIMVANETKFDATGYTEAQLATILSGLRWSLTNLLLKNTAVGMSNPLATTMFLTPLVAVTLLGSFAILEGFGTLASSPHVATLPGAMQIGGIVVSSGVVAFVLVILEFSVISETSVVTFSVAGIFKEIITIATSAIVFGDRFTGNVLLGLAVSIAGIAGYNYLRIVQARERDQLPHAEALDDEVALWHSLQDNDISIEGSLEDDDVLGGIPGVGTTRASGDGFAPFARFSLDSAEPDVYESLATDDADAGEPEYEMLELATRS